MQSKAILAAVLVASAFAGVGFASAGAESTPAGADSTPAGADSASVAGSHANAGVGTGDASVAAQDDEITGSNVTLRNLNLTNVTLENVYVNRLVANATHDGEDETVELRNVTIAEVRVGYASLSNVTFDTVGMNQQFSTDLLGEVGTGTDPEDTLPPEPMEGRNLSDRTITGIELGELDASSTSLQNVTVEDGSADAPADIPNGTVSGQGVTVEEASADDVTVVGWSAGLDESDEANETQS